MTRMHAGCHQLRSASRRRSNSAWRGAVRSACACSTELQTNAQYRSSSRSAIRYRELCLHARARTHTHTHTHTHSLRNSALSLLQPCNQALRGASTSRRRSQHALEVQALQQRVGLPVQGCKDRVWSRLHQSHAVRLCLDARKKHALQSQALPEVSPLGCLAAAFGACPLAAQAALVCPEPLAFVTPMAPRHLSLALNQSAALSCRSAHQQPLSPSSAMHTRCRPAGRLSTLLAGFGCPARWCSPLACAGGRATFCAKTAGCCCARLGLCCACLSGASLCRSSRACCWLCGSVLPCQCGGTAAGRLSAAGGASGWAAGCCGPASGRLSRDRVGLVCDSLRP